MRRPSDEEFAREIDAHIALETDRLIADGLSPAEARDRAVRRFGNRSRSLERYYESRRPVWIDQIAQDLRHACRSFARTAGFTVVAILTLAVAGLLVRTTKNLQGVPLG